MTGVAGRSPSRRRTRLQVPARERHHHHEPRDGETQQSPRRPRRTCPRCRAERSGAWSPRQREPHQRQRDVARKIQRHPTVSVSMPPTTGPATVATPNTEPIRLAYLARGPRRDDVGQQGLRRGPGLTGTAEPLDDPRQRELGHRPREPAEQRPQSEHRDRQQEQTRGGPTGHRVGRTPASITLPASVNAVTVHAMWSRPPSSPTIVASDAPTIVMFIAPSRLTEQQGAEQPPDPDGNGPPPGVTLAVPSCVHGARLLLAGPRRPSAVGPGGRLEPRGPTRPGVDGQKMTGRPVRAER